MTDKSKEEEKLTMGDDLMSAQVTHNSQDNSDHFALAD